MPYTWPRIGAYANNTYAQWKDNTGVITDVIGLDSSNQLIAKNAVNYQIQGKTKIGVAGAPSYTLHSATATANDRALYAVNTATTGTNYGAYGEATGSGATANIGGYFNASGATFNYSIRVQNGGGGATSNRCIQADPTHTDVADTVYRTIDVEPTMRITANNSNAIYGIFSNPVCDTNASGGLTTLSQLYGGWFGCTMSGSLAVTTMTALLTGINHSTGTIGTATGAVINAIGQGSGAITTTIGVDAGSGSANATGTVTSAYGVRGRLRATGGATITTGYSLHAVTPNLSSTSVIQTIYGLIIDPMYNTPSNTSTTGGYSATGIYVTMPPQGGNTSGTNTNYGMRFAGTPAVPGAGGTVNNYGIYIPAISGGTNNFSIRVDGAVTDMTETNAKIVSIEPTYRITANNATNYWAAYINNNTDTNTSGALTTLNALNGLWAGTTNNGTIGITSMAAIQSQVTNGSSGTVGTAYGILAQSVHSGSGTITSAIGGQFVAGGTGASTVVTNAYGARAQIRATGGSTITTAGYTFHAVAPNINSTGVIPSIYGVVVDALFNTASASSTTGGYTAVGIQINMPTQGGNTSGTNTIMGLRINGSGGTPGAGGAVNNWAIYCNSAEKVYFAGNVGCNDSSPTYKLVARSDANSTQSVISASNQNTGTSSAIAISFDLSNTTPASVQAGLALVGKESTWASAGTTSSYFSIQLVSAGTLSEKLRVNSSGFVGIGVFTSLGAFLHVRGGVQTAIQTDATSGSPFWTAKSGNGTTNCIQASSDGSGNGVFTLYNGSGLARVSLSTSGDSYITGGNLVVGDVGAVATYPYTARKDANSTQTILGFSNQSTGASAAIAERYDFATDTGVVKQAFQLLVAKEDTWANATAGTQDSYMSLSVATAGTLTEYVRLTSAGYLGIGETNPVCRLNTREDINGITSTIGASNLNTGTSAGAGIRFDLATDTGVRTLGGYIAVYKDGNTWANATASTQDASMLFVVAQNGSTTEGMRIFNTRQIGLGVTSLASMGAVLHQKSLATTNGIRAEADDSYYQFVGYGNGGANLSFSVVSDGSHNGQLYLYDSSGAYKVALVSSGTSYIFGGGLNVGDSSGTRFGSFRADGNTTTYPLFIRNLDATASVLGAAVLGFDLGTSAGGYDIAGGISVVKEQTWTSTTTTHDSKMQFYTNSAGAGLSAGLTITSTLKVGIAGSTSPTHTLQLANDDAAKSTTTTWTTTSDIRAKTNLRPFRRGLEVIRRLKPTTFEYNGAWGSEAGHTATSLIAQETVEIAPELFETHHVNEDEHGNKVPTDYYTFNPHHLFFMMINAIQELDARIEKLEALNDKQKGRAA